MQCEIRLRRILDFLSEMTFCNHYFIISQAFLYNRNFDMKIIENYCILMCYPLYKLVPGSAVFRNPEIRFQICDG